MVSVLAVVDLRQIRRWARRSGCAAWWPITLACTSCRPPSASTTWPGCASCRPPSASATWPGLREWLPSIGVGDLAGLRHLNLRNNQIHAPLDCFGLLGKLERIRLHQNQLAVPEWVSRGIAAVKEYMAKL
ncbi:hypothetical protein PR202_gb05384 [Eleusine coracana subsp. coracana]|uniref:Leucine-rich repeat domain-containing protein n=1 Tax=Eleusine coracana subsp. coracana TaxID=191504 RepID=A0AAV5E6U9_ELECO|nr:hypothetical protein PR202_gb05384 [Eleusine coracana subsp. coracana]